MRRIWLLLLLTGCATTAADPAPAAPPVVAAVPAPATSPFADQIHAAATGYAKWGRVDDELRLAPALCAAPQPPVDVPPKKARVSLAASGPHRNKVYYLWATDRFAYLDAKRALPIGMSLVKESFEPLGGSGPDPVPGARKDLFVMTKVGARDAPDTDEGWVYGTVTPDGVVTSAGRVASCMGCHAHATHERLIGIKP